MRKSKEISKSPFSSYLLVPIFLLLLSLPSNAADNGWWEGARPEVKRADERRSLLKTEYGEISAVDFNDGSRFGHYHLQFITMEPNSLFLPVLVHAEMVFYVHTGSGRLNWIDDDDLREVNLRRGDLYRLHPGSIFYLQSSLESEREKFRIYALFSSTDDASFDPAIGAYSSVTDLVRGFDRKVLREAFMAPEEVIEEIMNGTKPPLIVHAVASQSKKKSSWELEARLLKAFLGEGGASGMVFNKKKKKGEIYNVYEADPDFENCNGWSLAVTKKASHQLKGSNIGFFVVNLTGGSMMGPHWNRRAWEIGIVTSDEPGVVRVGCSSTAKNSTCKNWSFVVGKGDVFVVPRFYPMAQMSFNNGTFVFVGFSTTNRHNQPQFLAGSSSVLQKVDRKVLAWSFNVNVTTIDRLLGARVESVILECTSCAEEEVRKMKEEAERERQEEEERRRREEEEERRRREEDKKRQEEEEEERKREEEKAKKEEERRREEEEERKREEEEARRREEEEERKREEEEARRREEEEERKREEEEARRREGEEERKREEEEARRREGEEERKREEEEARRRDEEKERKREEEEEARKREEEKERREEEEERRGEKEERKREEEEARKREEEKERKGEKEERKREEEEAREEEERKKEKEWKRAREEEKEERGEREEEEEEAREREKWRRYEAEREAEQEQRQKKR